VPFPSIIDFIMLGAAVLVPVVGVWWHLYARIGAVRQELADYKVHAATSFAHNEHLTRSEERMLRQIDRLIASHEKLRADLEEMMRGQRG